MKKEYPSDSGYIYNYTQKTVIDMNINMNYKNLHEFKSEVNIISSNFCCSSTK